MARQGVDLIRIKVPTPSEHYFFFVLSPAVEAELRGSGGVFLGEAQLAADERA